MQGPGFYDSALVFCSHFKLMSSKNSPNKNQSTMDLKPFEILFEKYTISHQNKTNLLINCVAIPVMVFGLLGFTWAIPFPVFSFLGSYIGYINWASLLIALSIYFYLKISPLLSYIMLFIEFALSFGVIQLAEWQKTGGPYVALICFTLIILSLTAQIIGQKIEKKPYSFSNIVKFQYYGPIWLLSLVLRRFSIKY